MKWVSSSDEVSVFYPSGKIAEENDASDNGSGVPFGPVGKRGRMTERIGVVLGQIGTPQSLDTKEARRYLKAFLSDQRVVDRPSWQWKPILYSAVLPRRPKAMIGRMESIWTENGSPLQLISEAQVQGIQERLGHGFQVELGMAYSEPSIPGALERLNAQGIYKIVALPLFPQYSNSTTAAVYDAVSECALGRDHRGGLPVKKFSPTLRFVHPFYDDPAYIEVLAANIRRQLGSGVLPDRVLLSFHGLPKNFVDEGDPYQEQCERTSELIGKALDWPQDYYETVYQSRFGRTEWIEPYLAVRLGQLAEEGVERLAVVAPGFVSDCLETLHELSTESRELFVDGGGNADGYQVLECLNDDPAWLDYLAGLIERNAYGW